jgi:hypothetical protein
MEYEIRSLYRAVLQGVVMSAALLTYICYVLTKDLGWVIISCVSVLALIYIVITDIVLTIRHHKESKALEKKVA